MAKQEKLEGKIVIIEAHLIVMPDYVAREKFDVDKIDELALSIKQQGLINPILVKPIGKKYEIIAGHRRFLACLKNKEKKIKCIIAKVGLLDAELMKLDENIKRVDLDDIEEACYFERLKKLGIKTAEKIGEKVGKSEAYVIQKLAILKYPDFLFEALFEKKISFSAARELARIKDISVLRDYVMHASESGISPALAKTWADNWTQLRNLESQQTNDENIAQRQTDLEKIKVACYVCGEHYFVEETQMIRVCIKDVSMLEKARILEKQMS